MKIGPMIIAIALCVASASIAVSQDDVESRLTQVARELLEVTGAGELGIRMMSQMIDAKRQGMPNVPDEFWQDFMAGVNPDDLNRLVVPIYARHFTVEEMKTMIAFYKTPVGQKLVSKLPVITQESMMVGRRWGMELGTRIAQRLKDSGLVPQE